MAQKNTESALQRTFVLPLMVALPVFFLIFALTEGWYLVNLIEHGWDSGRGNVWQTLRSVDKVVWVFGGGAALAGCIWAWVILLPIKRYKAFLDRLAEEGAGEPPELDQSSELAAVAASFNRVLQEMAAPLPKRARAVLDTISSGVLLLDGSGNVEWMNPTASRLLEAPGERLKGTPYGEVFARCPAMVDVIRRALESGSDFPEESVELIDRFDEKRAVGTRAAWVRDSDGKPLALALTLVDVTRLESFASGIRTAGRLSSLGKVAAGIAHEVRNPLASIRGLAQLLESAESIQEDKVRAYTKVMISEVDRVNRVVDRLSLLVSMAEEQPALTSIKSLFDSVVEMAGHLARRRNVRLETALEDPDLAVELRPQHMTQAVLNMVINGVEAAPAGAWVRLGARRNSERGEDVAIEVENEGPSIPPSELDDLFQPFHTTKQHGTGLGLAITESIVREHGGEVSVRSGGNRTLFTVLLPTSGGTKA